MEKIEQITKGVECFQDTFNYLLTNMNNILSKLTKLDDIIEKQKDIDNLNKRLEVLEKKIKEYGDKEKITDPSELSVSNKICVWQNVVDKEKKIEILEEENKKLKKKTVKPIIFKEEPAEEGYNSGGEQPIPNMPIVKLKENPEDIKEKANVDIENENEENEENGENEEDEENGENEENVEDITINGKIYCFVNDQDNFIYEFSNYDKYETYDEPCGQMQNGKPYLF